MTLGWTQDKRVITVVSQLFVLHRGRWLCLIDSLFAACPGAREIRFSGIRILDAKTPPRLSLTGLSSDHVITLPASSEDYLPSLGYKTRKQLRNFWRQLGRECPSLTYTELHRENISRLDVNRIVRYNRERMTGKGLTSGIDAGYEDRLFRFSQDFGVLGLLECSEQVIAGALTFRVGGRQFAWVVSHKDADAWSRWSPGLVCFWKNIEAAIDSGVGEYHLLWGDSPYKTRLGAVRTPLYSGTVYRHRWRSYRTFPRKLSGVGIPIVKRRVKGVLNRSQS